MDPSLGGVMGGETGTRANNPCPNDILGFQARGSRPAHVRTFSPDPESLCPNVSPSLPGEHLPSFSGVILGKRLEKVTRTRPRRGSPCNLIGYRSQHSSFEVVPSRAILLPTTVPTCHFWSEVLIFFLSGQLDQGQTAVSMGSGSWGKAST